MSDNIFNSFNGVNKPITRQDINKITGFNPINVILSKALYTKGT